MESFSPALLCTHNEIKKIKKIKSPSAVRTTDKRGRTRPRLNNKNACRPIFKYNKNLNNTHSPTAAHKSGTHLKNEDGNFNN